MGSQPPVLLAAHLLATHFAQFFIKFLNLRQQIWLCACQRALPVGMQQQLAILSDQDRAYKQAGVGDG